MSVNKQATMVPGHGTLFHADRSASLPADPLSAFTLTGNPPAGWTNIGHTSKDNQPAYSKDGGDKTVLDSWLADGIDVVYAAVQWALGINALQIDEDNLDLAFGGFFDADGGYVVPSSNPGLEGQSFLLSTDGTGSLGFWHPATSTTLGDAPSIDASKFFELPLSQSILAADESVLPANENGVPGIMKIFKSTLTAGVPKISSTDKASGAAGSMVIITGSGFTGVTGATGVKFGSTNASTYSVISDSKIAAVVTGSAGSAAITVTRSGQTSAAKAFTIS